MKMPKQGPEQLTLDLPTIEGQVLTKIIIQEPDANAQQVACGADIHCLQQFRVARKESEEDPHIRALLRLVDHYR